MNSLKSYLVFAFKLSAAGLGFCANIFVNKISDDFPEWPLILLSIILASIFIYDWFRTIKSINPNIDTLPLEDEVSQKKEAREGLILFLSLYKNFLPDKKFTQEELQKHIKERDYIALDIHNIAATNFGHVINAIMAHKSKLRYLWIVTTKAPLTANSITSLDYFPVLQEYIKKEIDPGNKIKIYCDKNYSINITETSQITKRTYEMVRDIYKEAKGNHKLNPKNLIVDVTGGFTFMSVGAVLASLAKDQDVQVIGSEYDPKTGNPVGSKSYPVKIGYRPQFSLE